METVIMNRACPVDCTGVKSPVDSLVSLCWSMEPPKTPGWYWVKSLWLNGVVNVFVRPGHEYLCILNPTCCEHTKRDFLMVEKLPVEGWAGPISEPLEAN